ncbi:hypothetical protein D3C87_370970 [compost metagenome]
MKNSTFSVPGKIKAAKSLAFVSIQLLLLSFSSNVFSQAGCLPAFQYNADGNMITRVQFGTIDKTSPFTSGTTPVYEDFTSNSTDVTIGDSYTISIKGPSSTFPSDVMVFIDWNQNGLFDEAGIYIGSISPANPANAVTISASITIPANALTGTTKLRIVKNTNVTALSNPSAPNTIVTACDQNLRAGQTEDYSLNVLPGAPNCTGDPGPNIGDLGCVTFTYKGVPTQYTTVRAADGNIWLQQNLGSNRVATASNDTVAFGDLFQWGRWDDGHQSRTSALSTVAPAPNNPSGLTANPQFLNSTPVWWDAAALTDTWNAETPGNVSVTNGCDPCKALGNEWHLPSESEWETAVDADTMNNILSAFESTLKLATGGTRNASGTFDFVGLRGYYWSNTTSSSGGKMLYYSNFIVNPSAGYPRRQGGAIRCLKAAPANTVASIDVVTQNSVPATITTNAGTLQTEAVILPAAANQDVTWSIVNGTGTATISTNGLVTAQANGTVWAKAISVENTAIMDSLLITISNQLIPVQSIDVVTQNNVTAAITTNGGTLQTQAIILPAAANQDVTWSIVNGTGTATIATNGLVTALTNGTVWAKAISVENTTIKDSLLITISGQSGLGLTENTQAEIRVYPNPAKSVIYVQLEQNNAAVNLRLSDSKGSIVYEGTENGSAEILAIDISKLEPGIYYLRVNGTGITSIQKVIKE